MSFISRSSAVAICVASMICSGSTALAVTIPSSAVVAPAPDARGDGLDAQFHASSSTLSSNAAALALIDSTAPTATFVSTLVDYPNGASNNMASVGSLTSFLGADAATLDSGGGSNITNSAFLFRGFIYIDKSFDVSSGNDTIDVIFAVGSDDGMRLRIGGVTVVEFSGPRSFRFSGNFASFESAGLYPVELLFWERTGLTGVEWYSSIAGGPDSGAPNGTVGIVPKDVLFRENLPPECDAGGPYSLECEGASTAVVLDASASSDPEGTALSFSWTSDCPGASFDDDGAEQPLFSLDTSSGLPLECSVQLRVEDADGRTATCSAKVGVSDGQAPAIICPGPLTVVPPSGCDGIVPDLASIASVSDACASTASIETSQTPAPGTSLPPGTHSITLKSTDPSGNSATCTTSLTVIDPTPPVLVCPDTISVAPNAGCSYDGPIGSTSATDNCTPDELIAISSDAPTVFPTGTTIVNWTAIDEAGNASTCSTSVVVEDDLPPEISCPGDLTVLANAGCGYVGPFGSATATDNCTPTPAIVITSDAPGSFPVGTTTVTWTATDLTGNSASCAVEITVLDRTPPLAVCPATIVREANVGCSYVGPFGGPTVSDNCSEPSEIVLVNDAPGVFPPGPTTVGWTATDQAGNASSCEVNVVVIDATPPTIFCPATIVAECSGPEGAVVEFSPNATDNCDTAPQVRCEPPSGSVFPPGTSSVICTAIDAAGNVARCELTVFVACRGQVPGDCDLDGIVGISDAICLLDFLFGNSSFSRLPCGNGTRQDPGNLQLLGWNDDGDLTLTDVIGLLGWRFLGGPPHPLGSECIRLPGCPDACSLE